jgi:hypothetical protein
VPARRCQWGEVPSQSSIPLGAQPEASTTVVAEMRTGIMCLHFSYPDSIRTRARRFLRCIPSQVCLEPLTARPREEC